MRACGMLVLMEDTIFAKIIRREIAADIVYEDDDTLAFLSERYNNLGHTLVIPKTYSRNILSISEKSLAVLMQTVRKLAPVVMRAVDADGINIIINNESAAGQLIFHTHVHLIPRFVGDGYKGWPSKPYKNGEAQTIAEKIRAAM